MRIRGKRTSFEGVGRGRKQRFRVVCICFEACLYTQVPMVEFRVVSCEALAARLLQGVTMKASVQSPRVGIASTPPPRAARRPTSADYGRYGAPLANDLAREKRIP